MQRSSGTPPYLDQLDLVSAIRIAQVKRMNSVFGTWGVSLTRLHDAYGTGLNLNFGNGEWQVSDTQSGTWFESKWGRTRIRVYLQASSYLQGLQLAIGILLTVLAGLSTRYWSSSFLF